MADLKQQARILMAGLMVTGIASGVAFGYPEEKEKPKGELGAVLEKVPPEVREKVKAEFERISAEAEKVRAQAALAQKQARVHLEQFERSAQEQAKRIQGEAKAEIERIQRETRKEIERVQNEVRRHMDERERVRNAALLVEGRKLAEIKGADSQKNTEVRREMRVEVLKDGDGEPKVQIFENGKPVEPATVDIRGSLKGFSFVPGIDLSKLPPEKREAIEKARREVREANEKLAKLEGRDVSQVTGYGFNVPGQDGTARIEVRSFAVGDRLPGMPLLPGAVVRGDRLPAIPVPPVPPGNPDLEKRVSKAEKALDDILNELKKLRDEDEDDDENEEDEKEAKQKPKKQKKG